VYSDTIDKLSKRFALALNMVNTLYITAQTILRAPNKLMAMPLTDALRMKSALLCLFLFLFVLHAGLLLLGLIAEGQELEVLLGEFSYPRDTLLFNITILGNYLINAQLLIGLLWLMFHTHLIQRAGIILRRHACSIHPELNGDPVYGAHGCRAPPLA
jgi:hypothetical protein